MEIIRETGTGRIGLIEVYLLPFDIAGRMMVIMRKDAYLSLSLPPLCCSGNFDEVNGDTGLPVGGSHSVRLVVMGLVYDM